MHIVNIVDQGQGKNVHSIVWHIRMCERKHASGLYVISMLIDVHAVYIQLNFYQSGVHYCELVIDMYTIV